MRRFHYGLLLAFLLPLAAGPSIGGQTPTSAAAPSATASTILLPIDGDHRVTLQRVGLTTTAGGTTWHGKVKETGERAMLMWWRSGHVTGVLAYRGHTYSITQANGVLQVATENPRNTPSSRAFASPKKTADASPPAKQQGPSSPLPKVKPFADAERLALEAEKVTIDLLIVYTRKAASRYIIGLPQLIALTVEEVNETFRNSGLRNISLRLVHTRMIDYAETPGGHFKHLYDLVDGIGPLESIRALRNETRADIVGMIVDDPSGCGLSTRVAADAEEAYFVVHHSCALVLFSIAHEVGHIFGARHDRQMDPVNSPFPYGHGYVKEAKWRDIMSYQESCNGCPRIPYWSNPRITYKGEFTGTDANDNARVILEQAARVSQFR